MKRSSALVTLWALLTGLLVLSGGCSSVSPEPSLEAAQHNPTQLAGSWSLVALDDRPVTALSQRGRPTLRFDPETLRASGFAGVNQFGGSYEASTGMLTFGPLIMTKMAGPPAQMDLEQRFSRALEATTGWRIANDHLELLAGDRVVARLARTE